MTNKTKIKRKKKHIKGKGIKIYKEKNKRKTFD